MIIREEFLRPLLINAFLVIGALFIGLNAMKVRKDPKVLNQAKNVDFQTVTNETFIAPVNSVIGVLDTLTSKGRKLSPYNPFFTTNYLPPPKPPEPKKVEEKPKPPEPPKPKFKEIQMKFTGVLINSRGEQSVYLQSEKSSKKFVLGQEVSDGLKLIAADQKKVILSLGTNETHEIPFNRSIKIKIPLK